MSTPRRLLIPLAASVLLIAAGIGHGRLTHRWSTGNELEDASGRLESIPLTIDGWVGTQHSKSAGELAVAEASGYILRQYHHDQDDSDVTVLMLCGRPGPISVHPPTACYRARGYRLLAEPTEFAITNNDGTHTFRLAEFRNPTSVADDRVAILWGWTTGDTFSAPNNPRLTFAGQPVLYKLYATWNRSRDQRELRYSVPVEFMTAMTSSIRSSFAAEESAQSVSSD